MHEVIFLAAEIVNILEYLHSMGVVHRDLKPENLILDDRNRLKVVDFGTAEVLEMKGVNEELYARYREIRNKYADESDNVMAFKNSTKPRKSFVGTVFYVAPEMLEHQEVDRGCDYWALGIIIYKMLTGDYLFNDANEYFTFQRIRECKYQVDESLPDEAKDLIYELLKKDPAERLGNGSAEDGRDINGLKKHPFFTGYDFSHSESVSSPIKIDKKARFSEVDNSPERQLFTKVNENLDKKIVLSGLVKKMKYLFMYNTRQLILYSNGTLEYFDPKNNRVKVN